MIAVFVVMIVFYCVDVFVLSVVVQKLAVCRYKKIIFKSVLAKVVMSQL